MLNSVYKQVFMKKIPCIDADFNRTSLDNVRIEEVYS